MKEEIFNILKKDLLENMYFTGDFDRDNEEFIISKESLYLEFSGNIVNVFIDKNSLKLNVKISNKLEEETKIKISEMVFTNSLIEERNIKEVVFYGLLEKTDRLISEKIFFEFSVGECILLEATPLGINIKRDIEKEKIQEN